MTGARLYCVALLAVALVAILTGCSPWQHYVVSSGPTVHLDLSHTARADGRTGGALGGYVNGIVWLDDKAFARLAADYTEADAQWARSHEYGHRVSLRLGLGRLMPDPGLKGQEEAAQTVAAAVEQRPSPPELTEPDYGYWQPPAALVATVRRMMQKAGMV